MVCTFGDEGVGQDCKIWISKQRNRMIGVIMAIGRQTKGITHGNQG